MKKEIAAITVDQLHNLKDDEALEIGILAREPSPNGGYGVFDPFDNLIWEGDEVSVVGYVNGFNGHCEEEDETVAATTDSGGGVQHEALKIAVQLLLRKYTSQDLTIAVLEKLHKHQDYDQYDVEDIDCIHLKPTAYDILMDAIEEATEFGSKKSKLTEEYMMKKVDMKTFQENKEQLEYEKGFEEISNLLIYKTPMLITDNWSREKLEHAYRALVMFIEAYDHTYDLYEYMRIDHENRFQKSRLDKELYFTYLLDLEADDVLDEYQNQFNEKFQKALNEQQENKA